LAVTKAILDVLLDCIGASDAWIDSIERTGNLPADADVQGRILRAAMESQPSSRRNARSTPKPRRSSAQRG